MIDAKPTIYYVYGLIDPITAELRYIGYSMHPEERNLQHYYPSKLKKRGHRNHWLKGLLRIGKRAEMIMLEAYPTKKEAGQAETELIEYYRWIGCNLTNQALGGEGGSTRLGQTNSPEMRANISKGQMGKVISEDAKEKMRQAKLGTKQSQETKDKRARAMTGKKHSAVSIAKRSGPNHVHYGKPSKSRGQKRVECWKIGQSDWPLVEKMKSDKVSMIKIAKTFNVGVRTIRYLLRYIKDNKIK